MLKAFVIQVDPDKDCGDIVQIARTLGRVAFKTEKKLKVLKIFGPELWIKDSLCFVAIVQCPEEVGSGSPDVGQGKRSAR